MMHLAVSHDTATPRAPWARSGAAADLHPITDPAERALLERLRTASVSVQLAPRVEPFKFCALIEAAPDREADAYLDALLRVAPGALGRPLLIRRQGAAGPSFDEAWLLALISAARRGDTASLRFAVASRTRSDTDGRALSRSLGFIATGLAGRLHT